MRRGALLALLALALTGCRREDPDAGRPESARGFPRAERQANPSPEGGVTEASRDAQGEAQTVMDLAAIKPGMTVADIGAGEGYYTIRLAPRVGLKGRVLAEDIDRAALAKLGDRVSRERLDNVSIKQGDEADPRLPAGSFDRVFLIHMFHEVGEPYAFLWHLRPSLRPGGQVIVVDVDRPTSGHGIPPAQLFCEFAAVGFRLGEFVRKPEVTGYFARFEAVGERPAPEAIRACKDQSRPASHSG
ncbi:MAG: methyltransferase domain-containing protein [Sphingomonadales bacterium]|nr:methyltransferase domain-containing protein [Sphingomonadales bacterium]